MDHRQRNADEQHSPHLSLYNHTAFTAYAHKTHILYSFSPKTPDACSLIPCSELLHSALVGRSRAMAGADCTLSTARPSAPHVPQCTSDESDETEDSDPRPSSKATPCRAVRTADWSSSTCTGTLPRAKTALGSPIHLIIAGAIRAGIE